MQTFFFSKEATASLAAPFVHSLIGKFSHGRPTVKVLTKHFNELKLKGNVSLKTLSGKHVLNFKRKGLHEDLDATTVVGKSIKNMPFTDG